MQRIGPYSVTQYNWPSNTHPEGFGNHLSRAMVSRTQSLGISCRHAGAVDRVKKGKSRSCNLERSREVFGRAARCLLYRGKYWRVRHDVYPMSSIRP
jgi:hypothetical protein